MNELLKILLGVMLAILVVAGPPTARAQDVTSQPDVSKVAASVEKASADSDLDISHPNKVNAVIYPFQSATVSTEVRGIVDLLNFQEGEPVKKGAVVAEVSKARYTYILGEFKGNYDAVCRSLQQAKENVEVQESLYEKRATTFQDLLRARSEVRILEARKYEADNKMKQAELNLKACVINAPFSGVIGVLYHEPYEAVDNLEKVFELVDTKKVYARANWPEKRLSEIAIGKRAVFYREGRSYNGIIKKISRLIDPASRSKRIHVLIDNSNENLEVGMSGTLRLLDANAVSSLSKD
jgi:RND family efflux transporter MFP subunit